MTAKEMKENSKKKSSTYRINVGYLDCYQFTPDEFQAFCEQLCKEQRELCALNVDQEAIYLGEEVIIKRINNAPMPEL